MPKYLRVAPHTIIYGADGRTTLIHIHWHGWGHSVARGVALNSFDVGPAGSPKYLRYRVHVRASQLATCDGHRTYLRIEVRAFQPGQHKDVGVYPTRLRELWGHCS